MRSKNFRLSWVALLGLTIFSACKKNKDVVQTPPPSPPPAQVSEADKIKDTALLYSRDIYLWYDQIPATFDARSYSGPDKIMTAIRQYSKEPGFTEAVDRWSFALKRTDWDNVSSGITKDFGLNVFFPKDGDLRVRAVESASPAGLAGIRRGWRITGINGNNNMTVANADYIVANVYKSPTSTFKFLKPDGTTTEINLSAATYQEHPIYLDSVYTAGNKKVGYMVFNSFLGDTTEIFNRFSQIFSRFEQENVSDVIVDLRYNGGGYVSVQNKLANYLAPSSANGNLMMSQQFNEKYKQYNSSTKFKKQGSFNPSRIFFIVSSSSASASELLINNLKPYAEVKIVGPSATYGKPVGYFPIDVGDWYIFPVSFRTTNKNGEGSYFKGFAPDSEVADGLDKDWGDVTESALQRVIKYINSGSFGPRIAPRERNEYTEQSPAVIEANETLSQPAFRGMIDSRSLR